jgi:hypothetical protein
VGQVGPALSGPVAPPAKRLLEPFIEQCTARCPQAVAVQPFRSPVEQGWALALVRLDGAAPDWIVEIAQIQRYIAENEQAIAASDGDMIFAVPSPTYPRADRAIVEAWRAST